MESDRSTSEKLQQSSTTKISHGTTGEIATEKYYISNVFMGMQIAIFVELLFVNLAFAFLIYVFRKKILIRLRRRLTRSAIMIRIGARIDHRFPPSSSS